MKHHRLIYMVMAVLVALAMTGAQMNVHGTPVIPNSIDLTANGLQTTFLPIAARLQPVGARINIYNSGPQTFPANAPFHITHGWLLSIEDTQPELFDFKLQVDGVYKKVDIIEVRLGEYRQYVYNFPEGMTSVHTFTGHWFAPCRAVYDNCVDPDEIIETGTTTVDVFFTP